jgi:GNAT superfamily N-acetyltransferase
VVAAVHRGQGIGRHHVQAVEDVGRARACTRAGTAAPSTGAAAALLSSCGWTIVPAPDADRSEHRRWERPLVPNDREPGFEVRQERPRSHPGSRELSPDAATSAPDGRSS